MACRTLSLIRRGLSYLRYPRPTPGSLHTHPIAKSLESCPGNSMQFSLGLLVLTSPASERLRWSHLKCSDFPRIPGQTEEVKDTLYHRNGLGAQVLKANHEVLLAQGLLAVVCRQ